MAATTQKKKHDAVETDLNYYNVSVFGDYFVSTSTGNVVKPFGILTLKLREWNNAQALLRYHILPKLIMDVDPEYRDMRRCIVLGIKGSNGRFVQGIPLKFMSREQIQEECTTKRIPLRCDMYTDITKLRNKLRKAREDISKFISQERKNIDAFDKIGDAFELNADVLNNIKRMNAEQSGSTKTNLLAKQEEKEEKEESTLQDVDINTDETDDDSDLDL